VTNRGSDGCTTETLSGFIEIIDCVLSSFLLKRPVEIFWPDFMLRLIAILSLRALKDPVKNKVK
jgi:hypothetical protein